MPEPIQTSAPDNIPTVIAIPIPSTPTNTIGTKLGADGIYNLGHVDNPLAGDWWRDRSVDRTDTAIPESGELMTIPTDLIGADRFSPPQVIKQSKETPVQKAIKKLMAMYVRRPEEGSFMGIWGFIEHWGQDKDGNPILAGIKVLTRYADAKYELPETFEGFPLYFEQAGVAVPKLMQPQQMEEIPVDYVSGLQEKTFRIEAPKRT